MCESNKEIRCPAEIVERPLSQEDESKVLYHVAGRAYQSGVRSAWFDITICVDEITSREHVDKIRSMFTEENKLDNVVITSITELYRPLVSKVEAFRALGVLEDVSDDIRDKVDDGYRYTSKINQAAILLRRYVKSIR